MAWLKENIEKLPGSGIIYTLTKRDAKIVNYFLKNLNVQLNKNADISSEAIQVMMNYDWPGNIRELENVIERAVILCDGQQIDVGDLALQCLRVIEVNNSFEKMNNSLLPGADGEKLSLDEYLVSFVKTNEKTMNETELAKHLGISRKSLWERRQRLNIPRDR